MAGVAEREAEEARRREEEVMVWTAALLGRRLWGYRGGEARGIASSLDMDPRRVNVLLRRMEGRGEVRRDERMRGYGGSIIWIAVRF